MRLFASRYRSNAMSFSSWTLLTLAWRNARAATAMTSSDSRTTVGAAAILTLIGKSANRRRGAKPFASRLIGADEDDIIIEPADVRCFLFDFFRRRIGHVIFDP